MNKLATIVFLVFLFACSKTPVSPPQPEEVNMLVVPEHFPSMPFPEDNEFTYDRWAMGKALFYEKDFSRDQTISCASCHMPEFAFASNLITNPGVDNEAGIRNVPSLANIGYHPYYTREGGVPTLEMQVLVPIQEHNEFDFNMVLLVERLSNESMYEEMSLKAYNRELDAFSITRALSTFERSLISGNSSYDKYLQGHLDALSESAKRGLELFSSEETQCSSCHGGFDLSNYSFENNGLYLEYEDPGREHLTNNPLDNGKFKVPSLRNVAMTAPYMHDGSVPDLEAVITHYENGGSGHPNQSQMINGISLNPEDRNDLIHFLEALSDQEFANNSLYKLK